MKKGVVQATPLCETVGVAICHLFDMAAVNEKLRNKSRLNVRMSPEIKARVQRAAHILGQDLTEFTENTLNSRAMEIIEQNERIVLKEKEYRFFLDHLSGKPARPSKRAVEALRSYRTNVERAG